MKYPIIHITERSIQVLQHAVKRDFKNAFANKSCQCGVSRYRYPAVCGARHSRNNGNLVIVTCDLRVEGLSMYSPDLNKEVLINCPKCIKAMQERGL